MKPPKLGTGGFNCNNTLQAYGNGAIAKIGIFLKSKGCREGFFPLEPDWLTKAAGPKLHRWGQS